MVYKKNILNLFFEIQKKKKNSHNFSVMGRFRDRGLGTGYTVFASLNKLGTIHETEKRNMYITYYQKPETYSVLLILSPFGL